MKLILGPKQAEFLKNALDHIIFEYEQFRDDQFGDGGPSGPWAIKANIRYANYMIKESKKLLAKLPTDEMEAVQDIFRESVTFD